MKALDDALQSFGVKRQAYFGGTFVGNHIHKSLLVCMVCAIGLLYAILCAIFLASEYQHSVLYSH